MIDVHPPEHPIFGVRDFLIHLFTISVGLLIALGLENAAEAMHHRHQRKEAETMIREEMQENRKSLLAGKTVLLSEITNQRAILAFVQARSQNQPTDPGTLDLKFTEGPLQDAAWRTANSTGAVSYMSYAEVERLANVYKEQDLLQTTAEQALNDYLELDSFVPSEKIELNQLSPTNALAALPYVRHALAHLQGMYFVGAGTLGSYDEALKRPAS